MVLIISQSHLSVAQASSAFELLDTHNIMFTYATCTLITEMLWSSCYLSTTVFNDCYSELTPYTVLANSYWVSVYDTYQCQGHAH